MARNSREDEQREYNLVADAWPQEGACCVVLERAVLHGHTECLDIAS